MISAILIQAASLLTLDTRDRAVSCPSEPTDEVVVCARRDMPTTRLPMRIAGQRGVVLIEPSGPNRVLCNRTFVDRAGLRGTDTGTLGSIGPVDVEGSSARLSLDVNGHSDDVWVQWSAASPVRGADCVAGPRVLGVRFVRFVLGSATAATTTSALRFAARNDRPYARIPVGKDEVAARFELDHDISVLTAPAARIVAASIGGTVTGDAHAEPIMYGVTRSVRRLETRTPLMLGRHGLRTLYVRVADYGEADKLRTIDPDEVAEGDIVAAAKSDPPGRVRLLRVGREALTGCASITVDLRRREFALAC